MLSFTGFDIQVHRAGSEFEAIAEAEIRAAHGEDCERRCASSIPDYIYEAAIHSEDQDRKDYEAEVEANNRWQTEP